MTMICDRCGESFQHPDWVEFCVEFDEQANNAITKCYAVPDKKVLSYDEEPIVLCPSCMAKLNDWLKGEQERQAKWIYDHERNSIECDKCRAEYKLSPYERVSDFDYCPNCGSRMEGIKE